jgi:hypothetical protein
MKSLFLLPFAFIPFGASPDYIIGYYEGWDDAQALFAQAMTTIDDREAAEGVQVNQGAVSYAAPNRRGSRQPQEQQEYQEDAGGGAMTPSNETLLYVLIVLLVISIIVYNS